MRGVAVVDLRFEEQVDEASVHRLHFEAFGQHGPTVVDLVAGLRRAAAAGHDALSLVAVEQDAVVGHVLFTRSLLDAPRRLVDVQVLSPVSVLPARQGRGIGSALVRHGLDVLAGRGVPLVFLEGPPAFYSRLGFRPVPSSGSASRRCGSPTPRSRSSRSRRTSRG